MVLSLILGIVSPRAVTVIEGVQDCQLQNGLTVILLENHAILYLIAQRFVIVLPRVFTSPKRITLDGDPVSLLIVLHHANALDNLIGTLYPDALYSL